MTYNRETVEEFVSCVALPLRSVVLKRGKVLGLLALLEGVVCDAGNGSQWESGFLNYSD